MPRVATFSQPKPVAFELAARVYVSAPTATVNVTGLSTAYRQVRVEWTARHDVGTGVGYALCMRVNGDTSANYHGNIITLQGTTTTNGGISSNTYGRIGVIIGTATSTTAGQTGGGSVDIHCWAQGAGTMGRLHYTYQSHAYENGTISWYENGGMFYNVAPPYSSLQFSSVNGNLQAGSEFSVYGYF